MVSYAVMESRFLMTGVIASVALHAALFLLLAIGPCRAVRQAVSGGDGATGAAVAATNGVAASALAAANAQPVRQEETVESAPRQSSGQADAADGRAQTEAPSPGDSAEPTVSCKPVTAWVTYVVKRGDTLTGLVRDTGCTLEQVARKNGKSVKALAQLKVGQRIKLPRKQR